MHSSFTRLFGGLGHLRSTAAPFAALLLALVPVPSLALGLHNPAPLLASADHVVTVDVQLTGGAAHPGFLIESVDLLLSYDPSVLSFPADPAPAPNASLGALLNGGNAVVLLSALTGGLLDGGIAVVNPVPLGNGGVVLRIPFRVRYDAPAGATRVDIREVDLNEGALRVTASGIDASDWVIEIEGTVGESQVVPALPAVFLTLLAAALAAVALRRRARLG